MSALLAVQNADLLRIIAQPGPEQSIADLARELGRDRSNTSKSVKALEAHGLISLQCNGALGLTEDGRNLLPRLDVLEGVTTIPEGFVALHHSDLASHPLNPRRAFDPDALDELRQDILQSGGITSSLLVRPIGDADPQFSIGRTLSAKYWIVAGERRWRAVGLAIDEGDLPFSYLLPCQVREMSDAEHLRLSIGENIQRVDLDHVELGQQFEALLLTGEDTPQTIAERLSKTPEYVQQHVRILRLGADDLVQLKTGEMTFKQALALVAKPRPKAEPALELDLRATRPAPEVELQRALPAYGAAVPAAIADRPSFSEALGELTEKFQAEAPTSYAAASGRAEAPPKAAPPPEPARATFNPSPKMRLILLEIAQKVSKDELARFREGYTAVADVPAGGAAPELVRARAIGFRSIGGKDEVRIDPRGPGKEWLERTAWDDAHARERLYRIGDAAIDAGISSDRARIAYQGIGYLSEWLNVPEAAAPPAQNSAAPPQEVPHPPAPASLEVEEEQPAAADVLSRASALEEAWTGKPYRFPPLSPSLPTEADFKALLAELGVHMPLEIGEGDDSGVIFDAFGDPVILASQGSNVTSEAQAIALAKLVRIALHVCAGEAAQKAL